MRDAESRFVFSTHAVRRPVVGLLAIVVCAVALLLCALGLGASPASAAYLHAKTPSTEFGPTGAAPGPNLPVDFRANLAVDNANRHLYWASEEANDDGIELLGFSLSSPYQPLGGVFPEKLLFGEDKGDLDGNHPMGLAVDNSGLASNGNIYFLEVRGNSPGKLFGYTSDGANLGGEFPEVIPTPKDVCGLAIDSKGHIWIADQLGKTVDEYSAAGVPLERSISIAGFSGNFCEFVFNPANDDFFISGSSGPNSEKSNLWKLSAASDYKSITEIEPTGGGFAFDKQHQVLYALGGGGVNAYNTDGVLIDHFGSELEARNIALDEATGNIYVSRIERGGGFYTAIAVYPPSGIVPDAQPGGFTGSTVEASVDPAGGGNVTECRFEYGTSTQYSSPPVSCDQATPYSSSRTVTATLPALTPEVLYHYRVKVANATGVNYSPGRTFIPHRVKDLKTEPATAVTRTGATLAGSYEATNEDTHFYFEWGPTTSYGNVTAAPPGQDDGTVVSGPRPLSAPISGLEPGTTYHYRVVASNNPTPSFGEDRTFTTVTAVVDLTASVSNLSGSSVTLNADWTGDGTGTQFYFEWGGTSVYGHTTPVTDGGSQTEPTHFEVNLSELQPTSRYHYRLVATNGSGTTATRDQSFRTFQLPKVGNRPVLNITTNTAELVGTVNPRKTGPTTYYFEYGLTESYGSTTAVGGPIPSDESIHPAPSIAEGLAPGTAYHYRIVATSSTGTARGSDHKFTTIPYMPTVSSNTISELAPHAVTFNADVQPGFGLTAVYFQYGLGAGPGYVLATVPDAPLAADNDSHHVSTLIPGLKPGTVYHFRAIAVNFAGTSYGPDQTFETPGLPEILSVSATNVTRTGARLTAQISPHLAPTTYYFEFGPGVEYGSVTPETRVIGGDASFHDVSVNLTGLVSGTTYHGRVVAKNPVGTVTGQDVTFTTPSPATPPPPLGGKCKKSFVKKHGKCVKKPKKKKHRRKNHGRRNG